MKKPIIDGTTNLEEALNILTPSGVIIDAAFDMEVEKAREPTELIEYTEEDNEVDGEIKTDIDELLTRAITAFDTQIENIETIEPKYLPRAMEVSKQYLDAALDAVKLKQRQKEHSDKMGMEKAKLAGKHKGGDTTNNTLIIADRNDILKSFTNISNEAKNKDDK